MSRRLWDTDTFSLYKRKNAEIVARLKAEAKDLNVRPADLRIATLALECDIILVTQNVRDFERVPGICLESWASKAPSDGKS